MSIDANEPSPAALRAGDEVAWRELVRRWDGPLRAYLYRLGGDFHEADELAAETFANAWRARASIRDSGKTSTWLFFIATNLRRNRRRWWRRRLNWLVGMDDDFPEARDDAPAPNDAAVSDERAAAVRRAVAELPEKLRAPLVLARFEGLPHAEIAAILGCSPKVVEHRVAEALRVLRKRLGALAQA